MAMGPIMGLESLQLVRFLEDSGFFFYGSMQLFQKVLKYKKVCEHHFLLCWVMSYFFTGLVNNYCRTLALIMTLNADLKEKRSRHLAVNLIPRRFFYTLNVVPRLVVQIVWSCLLS